MRRLRRLHRWLRDHPMVVDGFWAVLISLVSATIFDGGVHTHHSWWVWTLWLVLGTTIPLTLRRTKPDLAIAMVALGCVAQLVLVHSQMPNNVAALMMLYAVAAYGRRQWRHWWLGAALAGGLAGSVDWAYHGPAGAPRSVDYILISWVFVVAMSIASYVPGVLARQRADMLQSLRDRAESLERERDSMARLAAQEERARIAREMHDVVAHSLSVIVVQSDGAAYAVEHGDPDQARLLAQRTLTTIGDTARTALAETRRLVGVLRDSGESADYSPQATLDQLGDLVQHVRDAGMPATLTTHGDPAAHADLDAAQGMAAYRVVQEALTNAMKHAGPGAEVRVDVTHRPDRIELAVRDTGHGPVPTDGHGHGLIGMRERMAALGGDFVARERLGGGFEVLASLPLDRADHRSNQGDS